MSEQELIRCLPEEPLILVHVLENVGRMGDIECLFVTTPDRLARAKGYDVMLGEVLGKHSEISIEMDDNNTTIVSDDQEKIKWLQSLKSRDHYGRDAPVIPVGWDLVKCAEEQKAEETGQDDEQDE
jgi:hypothetical protein